MLKQFKGDALDTDRVFNHWKSCNSMDVSMLRIGKLHLSGFTTHSLRASKATQLIKSGQENLAQKYLRHKSKDTTMRYYKPDKEQELKTLVGFN